MVSDARNGLMNNQQPVAARDSLRTMAVKTSTGYGYWASAMVFMRANDISEPDVQAVIMNCEIERVTVSFGVERFTVIGTDTDGRTLQILLCTDDERSRFEIIDIKNLLENPNHEKLPGLRGT